MCPWIEHRAASGGHMSWETFSKIAENLHLAQEVDLTGGGEPLCNQQISDMVKTVKVAGCRVGFSTNGSLLTKSLAEELTRLGLDWISFSVDAANANTYEAIRRGASFEKVITNIDALNQIKRTLNSQTPKMMLVFVIMSGEVENYAQLPAYIELAHRLGVEHVIAKNLDVILKDGDDQRRLFTHNGQAFSPLQEALDEAERLALHWGMKFRRYSVHPSEQITCEQNPTQNLFFSWDGSVSPCITLSYTESRIFNGERIQVPSQRFGNINQQSFSEIWNNPDYLAFRQAYADRIRRHNQDFLDSLLGGEISNEEIPEAPQVCKSCYFLYGI
jgi:MoaA/NifB/PqqE/SkfB family radical SAM enzyme